jgi:hypothetical protein
LKNTLTNGTDFLKFISKRKSAYIGDRGCQLVANAEAAGAVADEAGR